MEKYKIIKTLGGGTFGTVHQAKNMHTGEIVAIKILKEQYTAWNSCVNLTEIKSLAKLSHPNVVKLLEVIKENNKLHLVFEYMDRNIYELLKSCPKKQMPELEIRNIMYQSLQGIYYIHKAGYLHRDLKPENILEFKGTVKIADFGLAKRVDAQRPFTDYVSTRWYRAPELTLKATDYDPKVDIFALGAIMVELYNGRGLFEGANQLDQLNKILNVLGTPTIIDWEEGYRLANKMGISFPKYAKQNLSQLVPGANPEAIDLLSKIFVYDSKKRISALEALQHPFFMVDIPMSLEPVSVSVGQPNQPEGLASNQSATFNQPKVREGKERPVPEEKASQPQRLYLSKARYKVGVNIYSLLKG